MSKGKSLFIRFEKWDAFKARTQAALKAKKPSIGKSDTILFNSVVDYQKFMSEQKIAILAAITCQNPSSIYQLAQILDRDFGNVQRDCTSLESMGFITLNESGDSKGSKTPRLAFNYRRIIVKMPKITYSHEFGEAALSKLAFD
jgi:predicted transcriptional regulator